MNISPTVLSQVARNWSDEIQVTSDATLSVENQGLDDTQFQDMVAAIEKTKTVV
jgi:hypothetical protein